MGFRQVCEFVGRFLHTTTLDMDKQRSDQQGRDNDTRSTSRAHGDGDSYQGEGDDGSNWVHLVTLGADVELVKHNYSSGVTSIIGGALNRSLNPSKVRVPEWSILSINIPR